MKTLRFHTVMKNLLHFHMVMKILMTYATLTFHMFRYGIFHDFCLAVIVF